MHRLYEDDGKKTDRKCQRFLYHKQYRLYMDILLKILYF